MFGSSLFLFGLHSVHVCYMSCIYLPSPFPYQKIFVSFNSNTTGAASGTGTAYPRRAPPSPTSVFSGVRDVQSLILRRVVFCICFFMPFYCLSFHLWLLTLLGGSHYWLRMALNKDQYFSTSYSMVFLRSMVRGERLVFVLLISVELLTITV